MFNGNFKCRVTLLGALIYLLIFTSGCLFKDDNETGTAARKYDASARAAIDNIIDYGMQKYSIKGALVAVWDEGYETLLISKGKSDIASDTNVSITDSFRIASNTKMFTAMALLMLADQKKIDLDDKVSKYLPDVPHADSITIRQLANHTSGYHNFNDVASFGMAVMVNPIKKWTPMELINIVKDLPLDFTPGEKFSYSNTGYVILGLIVEKASSMSWENFITEKILRPLMMNQTYCATDPSMAGGHMNGYTVDGTSAVELAVDPSVAWSAGSIVSTISDMKKWLDALRQGTLISSAMQAEQRKWIAMEMGHYGFGVAMIMSKFIGHTGGFAGFNSFMFESLDGKKCLMVVHNVETGASETANNLYKYLGF